LVREPFSIDAEAEIVRLVRDAAGGAELTAAPYWTDAAFIAAAGIPTVLYGPGGDGAHADVEWVSLADTEAVTRTLIAVAEAL
jgi:acetylornithine deacetylase